MPKAARPLNSVTIRNAIKGVGGRRFPLYDGRGLHIIVVRGDRYEWRLKYRRPDGRENRLYLGNYPSVSLADARQKAEEARSLLRSGIDPGEARKAAEIAAGRRKITTFATVAGKWLKIKAPGWSKITEKKNRHAVEAYLLPKLGKRDVSTLGTATVLPVIRATNQHSPEFARAAAGAAQNILRLAIAEGHRAEGHLLDFDLRHNLPGRERGHQPAATTERDLITVLRAIRAHANPITRAALLMAVYTAQRPANVVSMRWDQIYPKTLEWILPAGMMKMRRRYIVPLPTQALAIIEEMRPFTGGRGYVFPPVRQQHNEHLHRDALSKAMRDAGLAGKQTPHGLRATLRTIARERFNVPEDILDAQLAHAKKDAVQAAYDRAEFVLKRRRVMQKWANWVDSLE